MQVSLNFRCSEAFSSYYAKLGSFNWIMNKIKFFPLEMSVEGDTISFVWLALSNFSAISAILKYLKYFPWYSNGIRFFLVIWMCLLWTHSKITSPLKCHIVTISHFFHCTPSIPCHQVNSDRLFPWSKNLKIVFHILYNWSVTGTN